jgi:hypothetical protein
MGGMQMMLVIGALMMLSVLTLNLNRAQFMNSTEMSESEFIMTGTAIGQTIINEIGTKAYDQITVASDTASLASFTAPNALGPNTGEVYPLFNDVDDYNRLSTVVGSPRAGDFTVRGSVDYVDPSTPNTTSTIRTRTKRVRLTVTSPFMTTPVNLVYYKSY